MIADYEGSVSVEAIYHGAIVGPKGASIRDIESKTSTRISMPKSIGDTKITVRGTSKDAVNAAIRLIHAVETQAKEEQAKRSKSHEATEKLYNKLHKKKESDRHDQKRMEYTQKADGAYAAGDKDKAAQYREKAKNETKQIATSERTANEKVFKERNSKNDNYTIDLHGIHADFALEMFQTRLAKLKPVGKGKTLTVITGAGIHSDANGAKIKPLIMSFLSRERISYSEQNNGSVLVKL